MTESSLLTNCPHCQTRFRVSAEQLGIADGKVRCGHCMKVFNARDNQQTDESPVATPSSPKDDSHAIETGFSTENNQLFEDNPEEDASEGHYTGSSFSFDDDELSDSFRDMGMPSSPTFHDEDDPDAEPVDESWAEAMLMDDNAPMPQEPVTPEEPAAEEPLVADLSSEPASEPAPEPSFSATDEPETDTPYHHLGRDPISLRNTDKRSWLRTLLWLLVIVGLLGALVAQVVHFQFDRLSAIPELRPFYEQGCELAGCELKPLIDVKKIQSRKLVVRTDPNDRNALIVDAVIINRADFAQPFPAIALTFSNLNGDVVAQSLFSPNDYLLGDGKALQSMQSETPVRIAISIRDPGKDAVNYNIAFKALPQTR